jgi:hypothetical protein
MSCNSNDGDKKSSDQTNVHTDKTTTDKCSFISIVRNNLEATTCVDNNFCICLIEASFLDDVIISLPACPHPNVAVLYDVGFFRSFPMLMMERMEAPLSSLLSHVGDEVTLRERVDVAFGIVSAIDYFHNHLNTTHGLISGGTVFVTQQLSAKMLDPLSACLVTGKLPDPAVTFADDMEKVIDLLTYLLNDVLSCDYLRAMAISFQKPDGHSLMTSLLFDFLDGVRRSDEYCHCPRRQLMCQDRNE